MSYSSFAARGTATGRNAGKMSAITLAIVGITVESDGVTMTPDRAGALIVDGAENLKSSDMQVFMQARENRRGGGTRTAHHGFCVFGLVTADPMPDFPAVDPKLPPGFLRRDPRNHGTRSARFGLAYSGRGILPETAFTGGVAQLRHRYFFVRIVSAGGTRSPHSG